MSDARKNIVTWDRFEAHGFPNFRSRGTHSAWELHYDGDGWCLSQDGALLEWYGRLDEAMAWVGEEESRTPVARPLAGGNQDCPIRPSWLYDSYPHSGLLPIEPPTESETLRQFQARIQDCGDTLFLFLLRELSECSDDPEGCLERAISDIEAVLHSVPDVL